MRCEYWRNDVKLPATDHFYSVFDDIKKTLSMNWRLVNRVGVSFKSQDEKKFRQDNEAKTSADIRSKLKSCVSRECYDVV
jgi:hypothetical protein